ncbi:hypothetical protein BS50DRAFT_629139 [Corynespora cassiicola Philippines]|uniref:Uncharacterized protein n=1 Tax=Corynespora cassiicola Philippines TaxID=1448308 RepID=A0A2T2P6V0_CORCC|nr:hypothetical protein BS50DRAFT_629139 [Corynespora cassiicola Philippines]
MANNNIPPSQSPPASVSDVSTEDPRQGNSGLLNGRIERLEQRSSHTMAQLTDLARVCSRRFQQLDEDIRALLGSNTSALVRGQLNLQADLYSRLGAQSDRIDDMEQMISTQLDRLERQTNNDWEAARKRHGQLTEDVELQRRQSQTQMALVDRLLLHFQNLWQSRSSSEVAAFTQRLEELEKAQEQSKRDLQSTRDAVAILEATVKVKDKQVEQLEKEMKELQVRLEEEETDP